MSKVITIGATPGTTFQNASSDAVQSIPNSKKKLGNKEAVRATIQVEDNTIRYAFGVDPTQGDLGLTADAGDTIVLDSFEQIFAFRYISDAATTPANLQHQIEYE